MLIIPSAGASPDLSFNNASGVLLPTGNKGGFDGCALVAAGSIATGLVTLDEFPAFPDLTMFLRGGIH